MRFKDIPEFINDGFYQIDVSWEYMMQWLDEQIHEEGLQLNPDFQRGHVWTDIQQIDFLEFILRGGKTGRILYFNHPNWHHLWEKGEYHDFVCVDGLQRITAIQRFMHDEIPAFGLFYSNFEGETDLIRHSMKININTLKTKKEVLKWYIQLNVGGTPHTPKEIARVKKLMENCE